MANEQPKGAADQPTSGLKGISGEPIGDEKAEGKPGPAKDTPYKGYSDSRDPTRAGGVRVDHEADVEAATDAAAKRIAAGVESERARAVRALFKAEVATRQALGQVKDTSRELRERTDEVRNHTCATARHRDSLAADDVRGLPPAALLRA